MPAPTQHKPAPTGTDGTDLAASDELGEDTPFNDPLAVLFGHEGGDETGEDDGAEDSDEDDESETGAEADDDSDGDADEGGASGDEDGTGDDESAGDDDQEGEDEADETKGEDPKDKRWKEQLAKLPPEAQKMVHGMRERIDKLTAKREKLKGDLEAVTSERDKLRSTAETAEPLKLSATPDNPLSELTTAEAVQTKLDEAQATIDWCEDNEDGASVSDGKGGTRELTKAEVRDIKRNAANLLNRHGPARLKWLEDQSAATKEARTKYPKLFEAGETQTAARELMKKHPELLKNPRHLIAVGDMLIGQAVREGKLVTVKAGTRPAIPPAKDKGKLPPSSMSATSSTSAPAARGSKTKKETRSVGAIHKAVLDGTGDPLDLMFAASVADDD